MLEMEAVAGAEVFRADAMAAPVASLASSQPAESDPRITAVATLLAVVNAAHLTFGIVLLFGTSGRDRVPAAWAAWAALALGAETLLLLAILLALYSAGAIASLFPLLSLVAAAIVAGIAIVLMKGRPTLVPSPPPTRV